MPTKKKESHHRRVLLGPLVERGNQSKGATPRSGNVEKEKKRLKKSDENNHSSRSWHEEVFKPSAPTSSKNNITSTTTSSTSKREKKLEQKIQRLQNELRIAEARYKTILKGKEAELELLRSEQLPIQELLERKDRKIQLLEGELETLTAILTETPPFSIPDRYQDVPPELDFDCFADKKGLQAALRRITLQSYMARAERSYLKDAEKEIDSRKKGVETTETITTKQSNVSTPKDEEDATATNASASYDEARKFSDHDNQDIYKNESESITWSSSAGSSSSPETPSTENIPPPSVDVSKKDLVQAWRTDGTLGSRER